MSTARIVNTRVLITLMVGVIVIAFHSPAFANDDELEILWGPEVFVQAEGEPNTEVREFSIEGFEAPFILHLRNGTEDGDNRLSNAWMYLKGGLVISPAAFSGKSEKIEVEK